MGFDTGRAEMLLIGLILLAVMVPVRDLTMQLSKSRESFRTHQTARLGHISRRRR